MTHLTTDRTPPDEMLDLARLALATGLDMVYLGFTLMDAEFPAPIGWQLQMSRIDPHYLHHRCSTDAASHDNHLRVSAQVGGTVQALHAEDEPYWGTEQIRTWIREPRTELPPLNHEDHAACLQDAEQMVTSWCKGWATKRTLHRLDAAVLQQATGTPVEPAAEYAYTATNYTHKPGDPTDTSRTIVLTRDGLSGEWTDCLDMLRQRHASFQFPAHLDVATGLMRVTHTPPWHTPVARFDPTSEEWVR